MQCHIRIMDLNVDCAMTVIIWIVEWNIEMIRCQLNTKVWSDFYRVLIADDSVPSRSILARLLQSKCSHCDEAEDGLKAIEMVKASLEYGKPYDIILMDSEMPNINGPEAVR